MAQLNTQQRTKSEELERLNNRVADLKDLEAWEKRLREREQLLAEQSPRTESKVHPQVEVSITEPMFEVISPAAPMDRISTLLAQANTELKNQNLAACRALYNELRPLYASLDDTRKREFYYQIMELKTNIELAKLAIH